MPKPSLGCFLLVGCCLSCLGFFCWPFLGGDAKSLAWVFLARRVLTKWMVMGSVYLELFETKPCCILVCPIIPYVRAMEYHFVVQKCPKSVKISPSSQVLPCLFWERCQIPRLGVSCSSGAAFRAWVFLLPFLGAMPNPSLGCFLLVGYCLSCWGSFLAFFGGDAKSLAWWVFLARRVLTKWMVMGSVYLELFEIKPCCILVYPIIPYVLWNTIL